MIDREALSDIGQRVLGTIVVMILILASLAWLVSRGWQ